MKAFFSASGWYPESGLAIVRIVVGLLLVYHGWEIFDATKIQEYAKWDAFKKFSSPLAMAYFGKGSELVAGILLTLGLFTRLACLILAGTMLYITFFIGSGRFWYQDQHPFLFVLLALVFIFTGGGKYSMDAIIKRAK
jgi:putative oxidoreductase